MKKIILVFIMIPFVFNVFNSKNNDINNELIRIRVLANSNSEYDLKIKENVSTDLRSTMFDLLKNTEDIDIARNIIKNNMNNIEKTVSNNLKNVDYSYKLNYGLNYFPEKEHNGTIYKSGEYESLLVTLGKGEGDNWWCILFPPFCLLEAEDSSEEIEYSFFFEELFDKIFH